MGTFHDDRGELHGMTVVAETADTVYVGRCDTVDDRHVVLLDADQHTEGEDGRTNAEWLRRAARFGVWKKHDRLALERDEVTTLTLLGDFVRRGATRPAPAPAATTTAAQTAAEPGAAPAGAALVELTDAARDEVRRLLASEAADGRGLRLGVSGGGCSGLVYKVEFDERRDGDLVVADTDFDVLLDRKSAIYLRGVTLDHQGGLQGRGFVFRNPNAANTCGCGESFAV